MGAVIGVDPHKHVLSAVALGGGAGPADHLGDAR
jgi:hypothetical protein